MVLFLCKLDTENTLVNFLQSVFLPDVNMEKKDLSH